MMQKYLYSEADADALCDFLLPMLAPDFHKRARASDMIDSRGVKQSTLDIY